jgi:hypothetical protein
MHIGDEVTAYYLDRAVYTFGTALDNELERAGQSKGGAKGKGKSQAAIQMAKQMVLNRWLGAGEQQKFADPAAMFNWDTPSS